MLYQARTLVLDKSDQQEEIDIKHCGYPEWTVKLVEDRQKEGQSKKKVEKEKKSLEQKETPGLAVLPYVKGLSEGAVRVIIKHSISSAFKLANPIGQHLFRFKR